MGRKPDPTRNHRHAILLRLPVDVLQAVDERTAINGLSRNETLTRLIAWAVLAAPRPKGNP